MFTKKRISIFFAIVFIFSIILPQIALAQATAEIPIIEDLTQIEILIYGEPRDDSLLNRVELLEKDLVGRTLPGIITDRVKQLKDFVITGTPEEPSLSFKINSTQRVLQDRITEDPLLPKIEDLELTIFGELSEEVLAMRAEKIFNVCFPEGRPASKEINIPAGTLIPVTLLDKISSKKNKGGDTFTYQVAEDIVYAGSVIIPKGTTAQGEVIKAKKASVLLKRGQLELDFKSIETLGGSHIKLDMAELTEDEKTRLGVAVGAGIAGLIILSNPIGLAAGALVPGKNVILKEGTRLYLEVAEDAKIMSLAQ